MYIRDWVHERHVDLDGFSHQVFDFTKHGEVILGLDIFGVCGVQTRDEPTKRGDTDSLADTEYGSRVYQTGQEIRKSLKLTGINMCGSSFQSGVSVSNG